MVKRGLGFEGKQETESVMGIETRLQMLENNLAEVEKSHEKLLQTIERFNARVKRESSNEKARQIHRANVEEGLRRRVAELQLRETRENKFLSEFSKSSPFVEEEPSASRQSNIANMTEIIQHMPKSIRDDIKQLRQALNAGEMKEHVANLIPGVEQRINYFQGQLHLLAERFKE